MSEWERNVMGILSEDKKYKKKQSFSDKNAMNFHFVDAKQQRIDFPF